MKSKNFDWAETWEEVSKALLQDIGIAENKDPYGSSLLIHHTMFLIDSMDREELIQQLKAKNLQSEATFSERLNDVSFRPFFY